MFGVIVAGRLVQTDVQQISDTQFLFNIPDADNVNHIAVFMTGQVPFPDTMGGAVYFSWPGDDGGVSGWQLLGSISNAKPSVIFKIAKLKTGESSVPHPFGVPSSHTAQIGISVEPLDQIAQQTPVENSQASTVNTMAEFSTKMCEGLFNYVSSFAVRQAEMTPNPSETFVPFGAIQKWYETFQRRLTQNPNFWKT